MASAMAVGGGAQVARRDAEAQLLAIGGEFRRALESWRGYSGGIVAGTPASGGPRELSDLVRDPRSPGVKRHLRRLYDDPLTGRADWGLVRGADGTIVGIYSNAPGEPIKKSGFDATWAGFDEAKRYSDWVFAARAPAGRR